jgi:hypothetical protein
MVYQQKKKIYLIYKREIIPKGSTYLNGITTE